jgi:hypothetical protein
MAASFCHALRRLRAILKSGLAAQALPSPLHGGLRPQHAVRSAGEALDAADVQDSPRNPPARADSTADLSERQPRFASFLRASSRPDVTHHRVETAADWCIRAPSIMRLAATPPFTEHQ